jgi:hypothetical protein
MNSIVRSMEINTQKLGTGYRGVIKSRTDNQFGEFTLPLRTSKTNITQAIYRLFVRVSRCRRAHLSSYGGKSYMSVQPKPRKAYRTRDFRVYGSLNSNESLLINSSIAKAFASTFHMFRKIHFLVHDDTEIVYGAHPIEHDPTQHV